MVYFFLIYYFKKHFKPSFFILRALKDILQHFGLGVSFFWCHKQVVWILLKINVDWNVKWNLFSVDWKFGQSNLSDFIKGQICTIYHEEIHRWLCCLWIRSIQIWSMDFMIVQYFIFGYSLSSSISRRHDRWFCCS